MVIDTVFEVSEDDEFCSHVLIDKTDGSRVRVIEVSKTGPFSKSGNLRRKVDSAAVNFSPVSYPECWAAR
jgi:hypothetical protein